MPPSFLKTLAEVIAFNKQHEKTAMPYFKQETLERSEARPGLDNSEYTEALKKLMGSRKVIDDLACGDGRLPAYHGADGGGDEPAGGDLFRRDCVCGT